MKRLPVLLFLFLLPSLSFGQYLPHDAEMALQRIQQSIRTGNIAAIDDMLESGMYIRLGDSLYKGISSIKAAEVLKNFFDGKKTDTFQFTGIPGYGKLIYTEGDKKDTSDVQVWLSRSMTGPVITAINISNYPVATVFFDMHRDKKKK